MLLCLFLDINTFRIGGYDPRVEDNMMTLVSLVDAARSHSLTYNVVAPSSSNVAIPPFNITKVEPDILFLLNFTTAQRTALLTANSTLILLYTPENEHFGIGPVEGMFCGLPILACNSGGPTESVVDAEDDRTGWLRPPQPDLWAKVLESVVAMSAKERSELIERCKRRAREYFGMEAMAESLQDALLKSVALGPVQLSNWYLTAVIIFALGIILQTYIFTMWFF
jgi:alpha-1,3/alpha-1,6-mannosyltransferase